MTNQDIHSVVGDEGAALGRAIAPSSRSGTRRREPTILVFSQRPAALGALANDSSLDDDVPVSIGELSVRLLARFTLPRMKMTLAQGRRGLNPAPASAHDPWEE